MKAKHTIILVLGLIVGSHTWRMHQQYIKDVATNLTFVTKQSLTKNISILLYK